LCYYFFEVLINGNKTGGKYAGNNRRFSSSGSVLCVFSNFILILKREKTMEKYNGWTNYATWRVNLELFDGWDEDQLDSLTMGDTYNLSQQLKDYVIDLIECSGSGLAVDYALAFLNDVNWYEIAQHMINEFAEEN
jgi:hypothetical protein